MGNQVTIENTSEGGFGLPTGQLIPGRESIVVEKEIWDASKDHPVVKARVDAGTLIVDGKGKRTADDNGRNEDGDTPEMAQMRSVFNASYAKQGDALTASQSEVNVLQGKVSDLESRLAAKDAELATLKAGAAPQSASAYTVTDKGSGWFVITKDGKELTKSLRKDDVVEFPTMSADDQAAFVELNKPA